MQPKLVEANSATNQLPTATTNPPSPTITESGAQFDVNKATDGQLIARPPIAGVGCPGFDYCIDDDCPGLPKQ